MENWGLCIAWGCSRSRPNSETKASELLAEPRKAMGGSKG